MIVAYFYEQGPVGAKTFEYDLWSAVGAMAEYALAPIDPFPAWFEAEAFVRPDTREQFMMWIGVYPCAPSCEGCGECGWTKLGGLMKAPAEWAKLYYRQLRASTE